MKKIKKQKRPLTPREKETKFITITTRILLVLTLALAVAYAGIFVAKQFKESDIQVLEELVKEPDTSKFLTRQIDETNLSSLKAKIETSGFDVIEEDDISYNKFNRTSIPLANNISLTANELGAFYNSLYLANDKYSTIIQQVDLTAITGGYSIKLVATLDFKKLFSKDLANMPSRIYVISNSEIKNGVITPLSTTYNNMDETTSNQLSNIFNENSSGLNIQSYIPNLIVNLTKNISQRTNTDFEITNNLISFNLKTV